MSEGSSTARATIVRGLGFLAFWTVLIRPDAGHLAVGVAAAAAATWASLRLLPPASLDLRPTALLGLALRFLRGSVTGGWDVARRALDPRLPLRPGFVVYEVGFPRGHARNAFAAFSSLLPGTVPAGEETRALIYHCLDVEQPIVAQLHATEAALAKALGHD